MKKEVVGADVVVAAEEGNLEAGKVDREEVAGAAVVGIKIEARIDNLDKIKIAEIFVVQTGIKMY